MYTRAIEHNIDWLHEIDGMSVRKAIEFLQTLPPDFVLAYSVEGDTYSVDVSSYLMQYKGE